MDVLNYTKQEDGSAKLEVQLTEVEMKFLVEFAFNRILEKYLEDCIDREIEKGNIIES